MLQNWNKLNKYELNLLLKTLNKTLVFKLFFKLLTSIILQNYFLLLFKL
jgi:hypothetical protein